MVQPDDLGTGSFIREVASHRVTDILAKLLGRVALRENGRTNGMRGEPAIGILLDDEDDLGAHAAILVRFPCRCPTDTSITATSLCRKSAAIVPARPIRLTPAHITLHGILE